MSDKPLTPPDGLPGDAVTVSIAGGVVSPPAPSSVLFPGQPFGAYRIVRLLGRGGMGEVYEAEETASSRRVALKLFNRSIGDPIDRERFLREGQLAASISHPHCVYVLGTDEIQGLPVLAMELVPGGTLKDMVESRGPLPAREAVDLILQVVDGLEAAAAGGVLHRDVKPANCFVGRDGRVKVGDFGLSTSRLAREETELTLAGSMMGTPGYAAPEQLRGERTDVRADIYAVGATLYSLLTARPPFESGNLVALVSAVLQTTPPSPKSWQPSVPEALASVVMRCLAKAPADRPQNYEELRDLLLPFCSLAPTPATVGLRCAAGLIDGIVCMFLGAPLSMTMMRSGISAQLDGATGLSDAQMWALILASHAVSALYYLVLEGLWGAGAGKAMLGLRVIHRTRRTAPGILRQAARVSVWSAAIGATTIAVASIWGPIALFAPSLRPGTPQLLSVVTSLGPVFGLVLLFSTMRRRNGFAGLHELVSGTRVASRHAVAAGSLRAREAGAAAPASAASERIGPYRVIARDMTSCGEVISAYDDHLRRRVWVRPVAPGQPALSAERRESGRPGRARWLTGCRSATEAWDAFEAWDGQPLAVMPSPAPWSRVRGWLLDVNAELESSLGERERPVPALDRVWIAGDGSAKLLDWPAPGVAAEAVHGVQGHGGFVEAQRFLHAVAARALNPAGGAGDAGPLPLHAARILGRLRESGYHDAAELADALRAVAGRPESIAPRRRLHLAVCAMLPLFMVVLGAVLGFSRAAVFKGRPDIALLTVCLGRLHKIETEPLTASRRDEERALELFIAGRLRRAVADPIVRTPFGQVRVPRVQRAEKIVADHPHVSDEDLQQARSRLGPFLATAERQAAEDATGRVDWHDLVRAIVMLVLACAAIPAVISAFAFRGGWLLRALGLGLATRAGAEASRPRALFRALVAWSPALAAGALFVLDGDVFAFGRARPLVADIEALLMLLLAAGAVIAFVTPSRSLQDRIAGTAVVVR